MTEPTEPDTPQPEPVLNAATIGGAISGLVSAVGMALVFYGWTTADRVAEFNRLAAAVVTAAVTLVAAFAPYIAALRARRQVTPVTSPRDHAGRRLVPVEEYGRHAAKYQDGGDIPGGAGPVLNTWSGHVFTADQVRAAGGKALDHLRDRYGHDPADDRDVDGFIDEIRASKEQPPVTTRRPLGRKPPTNAPRIRLTASMVPAATFTPPPSVDWYSKVPANSWGVDGNDRWGDCTCAEVDHSTKARQVAAGNPEVASTEAEVLALYSAVTGFDPSRPATDQGAVMQDVRDYWRKHGVTLGGKIDKLTLFAQVDHTDLDLIRWCVARFGAVALGINFPDSAMQQFDDGQPWDVVRGATVEGGHAVSLIGYDAHFAYVVTWGRVQPMTWAFFTKYAEEAWADVSADWINAGSGQDPLGEVAYALGEQFAAVTGKPNPFPAPAPPEPPAPAPDPAPAPAPVVPADMLTWARRVVAESWRSKTDRRIAQEILGLAADQ